MAQHINRRPGFGVIWLGCLAAVPVLLIVAQVAVTAFLFTRQPIWRATGKLLVIRSFTSGPATNATREASREFCETQIRFMYSRTLQQRVRDRLKLSPDEIRDNLHGLKAYRAGGTDIILLSVDSPSRPFAKDYANAIAEELLKFRDEERAQREEAASRPLTQEINRLSQELKAAQQRVVDYRKAHNLPDLDPLKQEQVGEPDKPLLTDSAQMTELKALRDDHARIQDRYNRLLGQLMTMDMSQILGERSISILEPAVVQRDPVYPRKARSMVIVAADVLVLGTMASLGVAWLIYRARMRRYQAAQPPVIG